MSEYASSIHSQMKQFDTKYSGNIILQQLENKTNLPKSYLVAGLGFAYLLLIFINVGGVGEILSNFAGFVLPAYLSLVALKTPTSTDDTQLLTYWIVFSFLSVIEFWSKAILYLIPFYWFLKTVFLIYIALPQTGGARMIYQKIVAPLTDRYILRDVSKTEKDEIRASVNEASKATGASVH
ncbi:BAQ_1a_G0055580.mRNA.1.CDS.1 [Saccharomyces cerevisiae]|nr:BAQ_1a_G0055580.mRNA.1.CDS.1 [Saccharomyces cerevisiae]CAI4856630.1 BAM_G0055400.mRNA.1.CDS.1 [Saccharomyces cerevisiae]CAI7382414.1 BAM_G0055400.mRNA.1.CDS.1 [Saccharomyces cerevisiae]CAI7385257.1 BAQ_1a_G0055580.mRNA.1.CDS.1 [Saccharomyces cerevisiae]